LTTEEYPKTKQKKPTKKGRTKKEVELQQQRSERERERERERTTKVVVGKRLQKKQHPNNWVTENSQEGALNACH
jgi:hypothetical protein